MISPSLVASLSSCLKIFSVRLTRSHLVSFGITQSHSVSIPASNLHVSDTYNVKRRAVCPPKARASLKPLPGLAAGQGRLPLSLPPRRMASPSQKTIGGVCFANPL